MVKQYIKEAYVKPGAVFLGVVHRLDRPVFGLVVFARTSKAALGEIKVTALVTMFKKIRFDTHETLGFGHVRLPETDMHTTAM